MSQLWWRYPADQLHHRAGADPKDPHSFGRTARTTAGVARPRPAHRLGRARASPRRPRHLSVVAKRAARDRHPQPLTAAGRRVTTKPRGRGTRRDSAPTPENRHFGGGSQAGRERPGAHPGDRSTRLTSRSSAGQCLRKCHWPGYPSGWPASGAGSQSGCSMAAESLTQVRSDVKNTS